MCSLSKRSSEIFVANKDWICDKSVVDLAHKEVVYMHCLPAARGFEVLVRIQQKKYYKN